MTVIEYSGEVYGAYIYFKNPKGEDVTFYGASNVVFVDYKETR